MNIQDQKMVEQETMEKATQVVLDANPRYLELFEDVEAKNNEEV